jgi:hypothetical protein
MKKTLLMAVICLTAVLLKAQNPPTVKVSSGQIKFNKVLVVPDWKFSALAASIGSDGRVRPNYNTTHTYDNQGYVLFEKNDEFKVGTDTVSEMQFYFTLPIDTANRVMPTGGVFNGKLYIEGFLIDNKITPAKMLEMLSMYQKTDAYLSHYYRMAYKGLYIYFAYNDAEDKLIKISIGPDKRKDDD